MAEPSPLPTRDEFARWVHEALDRLYDSPSLQASPLARLLAEVEGSPNPARTLRQRLLEGIRAVRPAPGTPAHSPDWRSAHILELRYIEGIRPNEAMQQLSLSKSHYYRAQTQALQALTTILWAQWQEAHPPEAVEGGARAQVARSEVERLGAHATWEALDAVALLQELHPLLEQLARAQGAAVHLAAAQPLTVARADRVMLRQAILNLFNCALDQTGAGRVEISTFVEPAEEGIRIVARSGATTTAPSRSEARSDGETADTRLTVSRQLAATMGGSLHFQTGDEARWEARLTWPALEPRRLLVIDDNTGFAELFGRYLAGYPWQVIAAASAAEARRITAEMPPAVIVLDVMMPQEDGWELLSALKQDECARHIPIIVCSVLNEPQMALVLGAAGYLLKPVTQQALLEALASF